MFARLFGSAPGQQQNVGASGASLVLHATLLGLAIHFSAHELAAARDKPIMENIHYPMPVPRPPIPRTPREAPVPCACPLPPFPVPNTRIVAPTTIPNAIPDPGPPIFGGGSDTVFTTGPEGEGGGFSPTVDIPARALPGNPRPAYPSLLRNARAEGMIAAHFVVDSAGRVDAHSITFDAGGEPLFESAVRRALLASRYEPARAGGHAVAMRVEQEFAFRITP